MPFADTRRVLRVNSMFPQLTAAVRPLPGIAAIASLRNRRDAVAERRVISPTGGRLKRAFDVVLGTAGLVALSPFIYAVGLIIKLSDGGPMFYGHSRIGSSGKTFHCLKLRTMRVDGDTVLARHLAENPEAAAEWAETRKLKDDPRVTRLGRMLRKTSLDELPQLINIVRGEMSIVGPRPVTQAELDLYGAQAAQYLASRPGLTGLWQVSGRNDVSYDNRIALDTRYVDTWSLGLDVKIIVQTVPAVLLAKGSY